MKEAIDGCGNHETGLFFSNFVETRAEEKIYDRMIPEVIDLFETTRPYSEECYIHRKDLKQDLEGIVLDSVWQQIQDYRRLFRLVVFPKEAWYLTWNPYVIQHSMKTVTTILRYHAEQKQSSLSTIFTPSQLHRIELSSTREFTYLLHRLDLPLSEKLQTACEQQSLFLIGLYLLLRFDDTTNRKEHLALYCYSAYVDALAHILCEDTLIDAIASYNVNDDDNDLTYGYLAFLQRIQLQISKDMVSLEPKQTLTSSENVQALMEVCPALTSYQAAFYAKHHEAHHYYTIAQFSKTCAVCYETARVSMDGLAELGWYAKTKVGRKFVYYAR